MKYKLVGYDEFSHEWYNISSHNTKASALKAAHKKLKMLEKWQPTITSGGQMGGGIQDRVFIENPNGSRNRIV